MTLTIIRQYFFVFNLLSATDSCSDTGAGFIIGGSKVKDRVYPWAGAFFYKGGFVCGGNLSEYQAFDIWNKKIKNNFI